MRRAILVLVLVPALGGSARAEIALLSNGLTLKLDGHRLEGETLVLALKGGGEMGVPPQTVRGFVPDEVLDEVRAPAGSDLRALAGEVARRHGLDPDLVVAVVGVESGFRAEAVSPKGAQGLMQLMPATASSLGVEDALDPAQNLDGGVRHLGALGGLATRPPTSGPWSTTRRLLHDPRASAPRSPTPRSPGGSRREPPRYEVGGPPGRGSRVGSRARCVLEPLPRQLPVSPRGDPPHPAPHLAFLHRHRDPP